MCIKLNTGSVINAGSEEGINKLIPDSPGIG